MEPNPGKQAMLDKGLLVFRSGIQLLTEAGRSPGRGAGERADCTCIGSLQVQSPAPRDGLEMQRDNRPADNGC